MFFNNFKHFVATILLIVTAVFIPGTNEQENLRNAPFNIYRIVNDPLQVKAPRATINSLFSLLNLRNLVRFKLWTRKNPELAHEIRFNDEVSLKTSNFDPARLTKVVIHGFADTATEVAITYYLVNMRDAYLALADVNVILVDYTLFAIPIFYYTSLPETAAARVAEFIKFLVRNTGLQLDALHLIGFSWGAHVAGLAGHALKGKIGRITGLDPAGPTFHFVENEFKLDKNDAKFVDIIHTNAGTRLLTRGHLGIAVASGHADIYPNGGERQIGCPQVNLFNYKSLECNHGRAVRYFIESITSPLAFPICRCKTWKKFNLGNFSCNLKSNSTEKKLYMGEFLSFGTAGVFQLTTRPVKPFGLGPQINVMLPNISTVDNNISMLEYLESPKAAIALVVNETFRNNKNNVLSEATLIYKYQIGKVQMKNRFTAKYYPNDDVIRLCRRVLIAFNDTYLL